MSIERSRVKKLHQDINAALTKVAKENGFVFNAGSLRYSDLDVSGRMKFVLDGKQIEFANRNTISSAPSLGLAVGDVVVLGENPEQYKIIGFSNRGSINVSRVRDNKGFRIPGRSVALVKRADFKGVAAEVQKVGIKTGRTEADIMYDINTVYGALSPENISCDGELPMREVNRRRVHLNRELRGYFNELGREVDESESWDWYEKNRAAVLEIAKKRGDGAWK
jgi:hypothetical protein